MLSRLLITLCIYRILRLEVYYMMLSFILEKTFALIVLFILFVYMIQKDLVDK